MIAASPITGPGGLPRHGVLAVSRLARDDAAALRLAADLADHAGVPLTVLTVVDPGGDLIRLGRLGALDPKSVEERLRQEAQGDLSAQLSAAQLDLGRATLKVVLGKPWLETVRAVAECGADWLVKTAEAYDADPRAPARLASTDLHLLRKCPATVWLHRADRPRPTSSMLMAIDVNEDPGGEPATQSSLNRAIVATGAGIAGWLDLRPTALSAWTAPGEALVRRWGGAGGVGGTAAEAERYRALLEEAEWRGLNAVMKEAWPADAPPVTERVEPGEARRVITDVVRRDRVELLVIGTIARTGVPGLLIGNTAEDVLNGAAVSVIAVKPPGFESPVLGH